MLCAGVWEGGDSVLTSYPSVLLLTHSHSSLLITTPLDDPTPLSVWEEGDSYPSILLALLPQPSHTGAQGAHITCLSCGAATPVQVVQDHAEVFLEKMNSKVLAPQLKALELIPESVECDILQSKSREEANAHLLNHLKEDADEESVREVFRIASEKTGYGKMKAFAGGVLRELQ